jgi:hypothetical protein
LRATASALSKCVSAFVASGSGDISASGARRRRFPVA